MKTPHIVPLNDVGFAGTVLMPGDPLRARMIAETFLENAVLVNNVRGVQGYTGTYHGHKVSVMASGMGIPSIGIYAYELYTFFGVENIIRVGSAGGIGEGVGLRDLVAGLGANTNSAFADQFGVPGTLAPTCSYALLKTADRCAEALGLTLKVGNLLSADTFYDPDPTVLKQWAACGSIAVEMEAAGLYLTAMRCKKRALAICTVSDLPFTGEGCTAEERQNTFTDMIRLALETAAASDGVTA
ncbi:MAG: purine-nucleoside phosphorylase [Clostridia bacterium]|nr:purine-nucleoside phosphorylase [Clostridia bacterium]MBR3553839.1 purine-nucleoside phosphorylase [Clostridia bacterium]